jgi:hypothetical protein
MYVGPFMVTLPEGGGPVLGMDVTYCGDAAAGERELAPLRAVGKPADDAVALVDYMALQTALDGATRHGQRYYVKSGMVGEFTPALARTMVESFRPGTQYELFFHTAGGAVSRVGETETAFPHRRAETMIGLFTTWTDPAQDDANIASTREWWSEIEPHTGGFYPNLRDEEERRVWDNYGPNYARLVKIKSRVDPANLFRLNANLPPGSDPGNASETKEV